MNRRSLVALALSAILAASPPAWAQGQGNGNGNANGQGNAAGQGNGQGNGASQGNGNGAGNGNAGVGGPTTPESFETGAPVVAAEPPARGAEQSESDVLAAVEAGKAVPLSSLMPDVRTRTGGEIINAKLVQTGNALLYVVRVLAPDGRVSTEYYDARSGEYVEQ